VIDAMVPASPKLGESRRFAPELPADDNPAEVRGFAVPIGEFEELIGPLVVLPAMRPDDARGIM
jgi:hypothetical protein